MAVAFISLDAARGETVTYTLTHQTSATNATPIDITGWTIKVTAVDGQGRVVLSKTATVTTGASGLYTWTALHADTLAPAARYDMDIQRVDSGSEKRMAKGTWTLDPTVYYQGQ